MLKKITIMKGKGRKERNEIHLTFSLFLHSIYRTKFGQSLNETSYIIGYSHVSLQNLFEVRQSLYLKFELKIKDL